MAEQLNFKINIGGQEKVVTSFKEMRDALKEAEFKAFELSSTLGEADPKVVQLRKEIGNLKDQIKDSAEATNNFAKGASVFPAISKSIVGLASAYTAVQGAIGILGIESKELEKQLLKVQSALAFSEGLSGLLEAKDAFINLGAQLQSLTIVQKANAAANYVTSASLKALGISAETTALSFRVLKTAIASTGILLAVVAISELVSALMNYTSSAEKATEKQKELNEQIAKGTEAGNKAVKDYLKSSAELEELRAKLAGKGEDEILAIRKKSINAQIEQNKKNYEELIKVDKDKASALLEENANLADELVKLDLNFKIAEKDRKAKHNEKIIELEKERTKKEKEERDKRAADQLQAESNAFQLQLKAAENKTKKQKEDAVDEDAFMQEQFDKENAKVQVQIDSRNKVAENDKKAGEFELQARQQLEDAKFAAASAGLNALGALVGENEKLANAIFVVDKALAIAKIIVDTQREIASISSNPLLTALPDLGASVKIPAIAAAKIRAAAGIATIAATTIAKFKGGASASNFGTGGAITTTGAPVIPQQQVTTTQLNQATINALGNSAIRAYVVETDITSNQKRIQAIKQRARFS